MLLVVQDKLEKYEVILLVVQERLEQYEVMYISGVGQARKNVKWCY